jgi:hypothetical protein
VADVERAGELDRAVEVQRLGRLVVEERAGRIAVLEPLIKRRLREILHADAGRGLDPIEAPPFIPSQNVSSSVHGRRAL